MSKSFELDDELDANIRRLAVQCHKAPDQIMREAITQYAGRMDARQNFLDEGDASWDAYKKDGLHLTGEEVSAWLRTVGTDRESALPECHD